MLTTESFALGPGRTSLVGTYDCHLLPLGYRKCIGIPVFGLLKRVIISQSRKRHWCCRLHINHRECIFLSPLEWSDSLKSALRTESRGRRKFIICCPYCILSTGRLFPNQERHLCSAAHYFCSSSSQCPLEGTVHKQKQGLSSAYHWKLKEYALLPQSNTTMEKYFALIKRLRGGISPSVQMNGEEEPMWTLKMKLKVTHLEYRH